jgi:predicted transcriptional regulator
MTGSFRKNWSLTENGMRLLRAFNEIGEVVAEARGEEVA